MRMHLCTWVRLVTGTPTTFGKVRSAHRYGRVAPILFVHMGTSSGVCGWVENSFQPLIVRLRSRAFCGLRWSSPRSSDSSASLARDRCRVCVTHVRSIYQRSTGEKAVQQLIFHDALIAEEFVNLDFTPWLIAGACGPSILQALFDVVA